MAGIACFSLSSCETTSGRVDVEGELGTPQHNLKKSEYPFDEKGNYREDWVSYNSSSSSSASSKPKSTSSSSTTTKVATSTSSSSSPVVMAPVASTSSTYHTVSKNDTLWGISRTYGVSVTALKSANKLSNDVIQPGQKLKIP